jgi:hypothetical protein
VHRSSARRGEGYIEYVVILTLIMICSVVGLLRASARGIDQVANSKALCSTCPDVRLTGDQVKQLHDLMNNRTRTEEEDKTLTDLAHRRLDELEPKRDDGTITDEEREELDSITRTLDERATTAAETGTTTSSPTSFWSSLWSWSHDSYLAAFMGIFGWFSFFG